MKDQPSAVTKVFLTTLLVIIGVLSNSSLLNNAYAMSNISWQSANIPGKTVSWQGSHRTVYDTLGGTDELSFDWSPPCSSSNGCWLVYADTTATYYPYKWNTRVIGEDWCVGHTWTRDMDSGDSYSRSTSAPQGNINHNCLNEGGGDHHYCVHGFHYFQNFQDTSSGVASQNTYYYEGYNNDAGSNWNCEFISW